MYRRLAVSALAAALFLSACSSNDPDSTPPESSTSTPAAVPLTGHVVTSIPGFKAQAAPTLQDVAAFAAAHDKKATDLTAAGLVAGVTVQFSPEGDAPGNALSIAEQYATPAQASAEAKRLFAANSEPDPGATATPIAVEGVPGAMAVAITGEFQGHPFSSVEIVYVDGAVVHELFAIGAKPNVDPQAFTAMVTAIYAATSGHPVS